MDNFLKESFTDNGYCIIRDLFNRDDIDALVADMKALLQQALHAANDDYRDASLDKLYWRLKSRHPHYKSKAYDLFGKVASLYPLLAHNKLLHKVNGLLDHTCLLDNVQIRADDSSNDRVLPMHQELAQMSLLNITCWLPLNRVLPNENGGLKIIPGSHKRGFLKHQNYTVNGHEYAGVAATEYDEKTAIALEMDKGDALLFHPLLIHGSVANRRETIRWTVVGRYNSIEQLSYWHSEQLHYSSDRRDPAYQSYNNTFASA